MPKLSDYIQIAVIEYLLETGKTELDPLWAAEFFQDSGVMEEYPRQNMVEFYNLMQKELTLRAERADKLAHMKLATIKWHPKRQHKD